MTYQIFTSTHKAYLPKSLAAYNALEPLLKVGVPVQYSWRFPLNGRRTDLHNIDFSLLGQPPLVSDVLLEAGSPDWMHSLKDWKEFLAIGTWRTVFPTDIEMKWHICVNVNDGRIFRVITDATLLHLSFESTKNMLEAILNSNLSDQILDCVQSESIQFSNSNPIHMVECLNLYFSFVSRRISTAEAFLKAAGKIDSQANGINTVWHTLVADCLMQDEF